MKKTTHEKLRGALLCCDFFQVACHTLHGARIQRAVDLETLARSCL